MAVLARVVGAIALALLLVVAFTPLSEMLARRLAVPPDTGTADAIVVLAAGEGGLDGPLSVSSLVRAMHGIALYRDGRAPLLVLSGEIPRRSPSEAALRMALAADCGVPARALLTDERSTTTREEARHVSELLRARGARTILLVTDAYHLARARRLFERAGLTVLAAPTNLPPSTPRGPQTRLHVMGRMLQEVLARMYYRLSGYA